MAEQSIMGQPPVPPAMAPTTSEMPDLTVDSMLSNYEGMEEDVKNATGELMQDPITGILDSLTGTTMFSEFSQTIGAGPAEAPATPAPQEGIMGPSPEMEAPATPAPTAMMSEGGGLAGMPFGETSPKNEKIIAVYKEGNLSLQGAQEFAKDIRKRRLSKNEKDITSKEEMDVFYGMSYDFGEENLFPKEKEKPAMAKGGALLSEKAKEMMRQGKSRQEILSSMR